MHDYRTTKQAGPLIVQACSCGARRIELEQDDGYQEALASMQEQLTATHKLPVAEIARLFNVPPYMIARANEVLQR